MDRLDRVLTPGRDLLRRVDAELAAGGAPEDHEIWGLLRAVGAAPSEALEYVAGLDPEVFADLAIKVRARADGYAGCRATLESAVRTSRWGGAAGSAFASRWSAISGYLGDGETATEATMAGRLMGQREYLCDVAEWVTSARHALGTTIAEVLGSVEALRLRGGVALAGGGVIAGLASPEYRLAGSRSGAGEAAATIAVRALRTVDAALRDGFALTQRWEARLGALSFPETAWDAVTGGTTTVEL